MIRTVYLSETLWRALQVEGAAQGRTRPRQLEFVLSQRYGVPHERPAKLDTSVAWPRATPPDELDAWIEDGLAQRKSSFNYKRAFQTASLLTPENRDLVLSNLRETARAADEHRVKSQVRRRPRG